MKPHRLIAAALALTLAHVAHAQTPAQRAAFVTVLGQDTVAVERFAHGPRQFTAEVLVRSPRTTLRVYRMDLGPDSRPTRLETTHDPAAGPTSPALAREVIRFGDDSLRVETTGGQSPGAFAAAGGRDVLPFIDMVHWPLELALQRVAVQGGDSATVDLLTGRRTAPFRVARVGAGRFTVTHPFRGTMTVDTDPRGRIQALDASQTTRKLRILRRSAVPLERLARDFAARDARGQSLGELSGRGTASATLGGATVAVDYGRPLKRGREIFGGLVPWDQVWRTGANQATHLTTDRDLVLGGTPIPAGTYTLFSIPRPDGWTLIVNRKTQINGTSHDAAHDLARIPLRTRRLSEPVEAFTIRVDGEGDGGVLRLQWDRTEAYAPLQVREGR